MPQLSLHEIIAAGLGIGLITMAFRLGFAELRGRRQMPNGVLAALGWVPVAALAAIVAPSLVAEPGTGPVLPALIAAIVSGTVAFRTRNLLLSITLGMTTYWIAQV